MIMQPMERTTVIRVMPETGLTPTMAIAWAATGVNRNESRKPTTMPTSAEDQARPEAVGGGSALAAAVSMATTKNSTPMASARRRPGG